MVRFVSSKPFLELPDKLIDNLFICANGNKELVVLAEDSLLQELKNYNWEHFIPQYTDVVEYLNAKGIEHSYDATIPKHL